MCKQCHLFKYLGQERKILPLDGTMENMLYPKLELISDYNQKISVMIGTLLCDTNSKITEEMQIPLRPIPKEDSSSLTLL